MDTSVIDPYQYQTLLDTYLLGRHAHSEYSKDMYLSGSSPNIFSRSVSIESILQFLGTATTQRGSSLAFYTKYVIVQISFFTYFKVQ